MGYGCGGLGDFTVVDGCVPCMWVVLWFVWRCMVELSKCALYLVVYGHIYITLLVIPIQVQYVV